MRRPERLAERLKVQIAEVVGFELTDPRLESVVVTDVTVSDDLRDAKVFASLQEAKRTSQRLESIEKCVDIRSPTGRDESRSAARSAFTFCT
ncbi:MAG: ribosome-binding factor A [Acidobacteria bacterium]|nr:ribosome-binding factor A [Acidobacteriota bacterium]